LRSNGLAVLSVGLLKYGQKNGINQAKFSMALNTKTSLLMFEKQWFSFFVR
jgi:hypothetical protein